MVNAEPSPTDAPAAAPENPSGLSKSQLKKLKRQQEAAAAAGGDAGDRTPEARESESPQNAMADDEVKVSKNGYIETVAKRLRNLKKKVKKIETYEAIPKDKLNADQKQTLDKKTETLALVKELEEIIKLLQAHEAEENKQQKKEKQAQEQQDAQKIAAAVAEAKAQDQQKLQALCKAFLSLNILYPSMYSQLVFPFSNEQMNAINLIKTSIFGENIINDANFSKESFTETSFHHLNQFLARSADVFVDGFTYADIADLVDQISASRPAPPVFGVDEAQIIGGANGTYEAAYEDQTVPEEQEGEQPVVLGAGMPLTFGSVSVRFGDVTVESEVPSFAGASAEQDNSGAIAEQQQATMPIFGAYQDPTTGLVSAEASWGAQPVVVDEDSLTPIEDDVHAMQQHASVYGYVGQHPVQPQYGHGYVDAEGYQPAPGAGYRGRGRGRGYGGGYRGRGNGGQGYRGQGGGYRGNRGRGAPPPQA